MAGEFASVIICVPAATGVRGPCPEGLVQSVQEVFLIPASEAGAIQAFLQPFDASVAGGFFMSSMAITVAIWFAAWGVGNVVQAVRRF
ncbi:hypothetical protein [Achromobacter sp.]|uniref:hypothetical protein n=1 Tax=Achromobacter sp. TaxID=134375 RepID=UPI002F929C38